MTRGKRKITIKDYENFIGKSVKNFTSNDVKKIDQILLQKGIISEKEYKKRRKVFEKLYLKDI